EDGVVIGIGDLSGRVGGGLRRGRQREVAGRLDLADRVDAADAARTRHGRGAALAWFGDVGGDADGERVEVLLGATADGGAVADLRQVVPVPDRALGDEVAGGEVHVVAGGAHR